ncbi:MAG: hypothetical protein A3A04_01010 [Candidatus Harrisonbacteria bacterium RIFCSPLOWO2_01_FULL_40_28]|uniref:Chromosomal replication initiator protein DnaA n=2 Tax=Candidatus Harrisoniibacteriota TaxID=1817905 RepID=A0A1G1ZYJ0_9BACT|nr:MAG: hypothetical protein A3A04_01010 [Candidatus Harrisonbacteria bacterium RIFCSPLOWO2_01_FULL_40_28]OGY69664.1 MAG: hypothetical protein A2586_01535 [Candidatus Harrisonbacteria bacterium RIFOXYD1_FULL_40_9]
MEAEKLWQSVLGEIELQISRANYLTWLKDSKIISQEENAILIALPNNFVKEWVENKYHKMILGTVRSFNETIKKIDYVVHTQAIDLTRINKKINQEIQKQTSFSELRVDPETNLNPRYTLDSFIVGSSNELAYAAILSVIKEVGKKYNPLFIYGGVGLGKTHLIQAAGNEIKKNYKNEVKVKYIPSETYIRDIVSAIRNKRIEDTKNKYRDIDVLIIDDIQFIGGKEKTEEEFFHTFNALYENNKQIIISSDRPPRSIPTLEERLQSRFEGGMIADVGYPDYETRVAIIKSKLEEKKMTLTDDLINIIANKVKRNVRELEGVIHKISLKSEREGIIAKTVIMDTLRETISQPSLNISPQQIIQAVAHFFEISPEDLTNRSRKKEVVEPRQIAAFLMRELLNLSYPFIGEKLGKRDHTTIIHSCDKIAQGINKNASLNQKILLIKEEVYKT